MQNMTLILPRRILPETYNLFLNYPAGVITLIAGTEPRKALRSVQRIASRIWEKAKPYYDVGQQFEKERMELLAPSAAQEEKIRELYVEKVALRSSDESWKLEQEHLRNFALRDLERERERMLWAAGYITRLHEHKFLVGRGSEEIPFSKDLFGMFVRCYERYLDARFEIDPAESKDEKEKSKVKIPKFVIHTRGSNPFGGTVETPLELTTLAEAEIDYAIGDYTDEEEEDLKRRIEQLWGLLLHEDLQWIERIRKEYGEPGASSPLA